MPSLERSSPFLGSVYFSSDSFFLIMNMALASITTRFRRLCVFAWCLSLVSTLQAQRVDYDVVPLPHSVQQDTLHFFMLQQGMDIAFDESQADMRRNALFLSEWVEELTGIRLALTPNAKKAAVRMVLTKDEMPEEAYTLKVGKTGITLSAHSPAGIFRGAQTLRKSMAAARRSDAGSGISLPFVRIDDQPRFAYRGLHLDCSRHFFPIDHIKQVLDVMALHGCNQIHWHLTDDQGWRFEVKALPRLAQEGSVREQTVIGPNAGIYDGVPHSGYYTQEECRELVRYAAERYINIVPEIDLPGHMQSALHVFPNLGCTGGPYPVMTNWGISPDVLCAGNPETLTFLKTVLNELCDVFPSEYIHIGGDECPRDRWHQCAKCQTKIKELGLADNGKQSAESQLQTYINREVEHFVNQRGRTIIGWDEILEGGLTEKSIVMSWRGVKGGIEAARQHHRVIMAPNVYAYFNRPQLKNLSKQPRTTDGYIVSASKVYSLEPVISDSLTAEEQDCIMGVEACLWTEHIAYPQHVFYQLLPRLAAMSEVQWCLPAQKDFENFKARLPQLKKIYDSLNVPYCKELE